MKKNTKLNQWFVNLGISILSLFIFIGAAESISRIWYSPKTESYPGIFEYDAEKVYRLKKSLEGRMFSGKPLKTNSFGYRDDEISVTKEANVVRVLVIGDSVSFGHGVSMEETYPHLLERKLNQNYPGFQFDVINTGVPGNSPFQEFVDLKRALVFDPDIIISQFVLNDVVEPYKLLKRFGGKGIDYHGVQDRHWLDHSLRQYSAFYLFLESVIGKVSNSIFDLEKRRAAEMAKIKALDWSLAARAPENDLERQLWEECLLHLQNAVDLSRSNNIPFLLFASPVDFQLVDSNQTYAQQRLKDFSTSNNISYFDILPVLNLEVEKRVAQVQSKTTREWTVEEHDRMKRETAKQVWQSLFVDYDHYNANGHILVSNQLYPVVSALLPEIVRSTSSSNK